MSQAEQPSLLAGFKEFITRGNVIDLAVAVVVGAAFSSIVNPAVNGIINPLVGAFGTKDLAGYSSCLKGPCVEDSKGETVSGIHILWGSALSATLTFLITAAVVYFLMVLPMARYLARRATKQEPPQRTEPVAAKNEANVEADEIALLRDIRDALVAPRSGGAG
ncbi:MscL family protein [Streptomyces sp. NRRL F-5123]|uniref:large conductance mechanosensitive channel protein MscL n=1 Tax=Streptomyces sp. NRRL F-5123 TaxID=1463856 RepID=UPI0004E0FC26|nr:MscL family protein [Streptomyces sp. NRRL F-5123]